MKHPNPQFWIDHLQLLPHPEGGFYRETYRSAGIISTTDLWAGAEGQRSQSTAIYFLLRMGECSHFHRIKSDEMWHFYEGDPLNIHVILEDGTYHCIRLGRGEPGSGLVFQAVVPAGAWFASEVNKGGEFALVGCTVAPGFDFRDFELAKRDEFARRFPQHSGWTSRLCLP